MSGRRRSTGGSGPFDRLLEIDPDRVATAVVGCGIALALGAILFGGFVPVGGVAVTVLYPLAVLLPVFGVAIVGYALRWLWLADRPTDRTLVEGDPPETAETRATRRVGRELGWHVDSAAGGQYRCRGTDSAADIRQILLDGAVRALTRTRGLDAETAGEALRSGTWTDDPVAAAFLATDRRQPPDERLRGAIDPGAAYQRRVRRTVDAIEAIDAEAVDGLDPGDNVEAATDEPAAAETNDADSRADANDGDGRDDGPTRTQPDDGSARAEPDQTDAKPATEVTR